MMLDNDLLRNIKNGVKGVRDAAPCLLYKMYDQHFNTDISIAGIDTSSVAAKSNTCSKTNLIAGKFISDDPGEVVAEQSFVNAHGLDLGDTLEIFGDKLILAGIVNSGIKPVKADFYSPINHVRTILKDRLQCNAPYFDMNIILVEAEDARTQDDVMAHIKNMMYNFTVSSYNCYEPAYRVMSIIDRTSAAVTAVIFAFLVIFSAKTQLSSLVERFREIGILKSLGWSDRSLSLQLLAISFIQAVTGVTFGSIAGIILIPLLRISISATEVRLQHILLLYTLSVAGAVIAVAFPVLKIYRSKAGDIIRNYS
jgi:predicted lysophospholipase L1 biosynthesis ABC-type transport system permease subunit